MITNVAPVAGAAKYYSAKDDDKFCVMMLCTDGYCTEVASNIKTADAASKKAASMQTKENKAVAKAAKGKSNA